MEPIKVEDHYGLVWNVVRRYKRLCRENGLIDQDDLFQEGVIALIKCAKYWDDGSMSGFPNYVSKAVQHHISLYIHNLLVIHPPRSTYMALRAGKLANRNSRVSDAVNAAKNMVRQSSEYIDKTVCPPDFSTELLEDLVAVRRMLVHVLSERDQDIVEGLYAIGREGETIKGLAGKWRLNRNTIMKIAKRALVRLKHYIDTHPQRGVSVACSEDSSING